MTKQVKCNSMLKLIDVRSNEFCTNKILLLLNLILRINFIVVVCLL